MRFFFPDSQDQVDPSFDFVTEERNPNRLRQRDDLYPHEILSESSYDGMLVSKSMVDGTNQGAGRYTIAQRHRIYRSGIREFLRLDRPNGRRLEAMGDCGAFTYVNDPDPPYTPDQVIDFYEECGFDCGFSVDHIIMAYDDKADDALLSPEIVSPEWVQRQKLTIELAAEFLKRHKARKCSFEPIGVAQGWSPKSYAYAVAELQSMGYTRIGLGGMVPLRTNQVLDSLRAISDVRRKKTQFHLLGVTRTEYLGDFVRFGVTTFDSTSAFRRAFKDDKDNYWTPERTYTALRVPQVDGNPKLKRRIQAGEVDQVLAIHLEERSMKALNAFDAGETDVQTVVSALRDYEELWDGRNDRREIYREFLEARPWKACPCGICEHAGIHVAVFRGSERNKRRGMHNLFVFNRQLQAQIEINAKAS